MQKIPILRYYVKPMALQRWVGAITTLQYYGKLTTARFFVVNTLQPEQTLAPIVGFVEVQKARARVIARESTAQALLEKYLPTVASQWRAGGKLVSRSRWGNWMPQTASEKLNQATAFVAMYEHGRKLGMTEDGAANYALLNGLLRTQFYPLISDTPRFMRGPMGKLLFQFKRFSVKNLELAAHLMHEGNYTGFARWLGAQFVLGGLRLGLSTPGLAGIALAFGLGLSGALYRLHKKLEEKYGRAVADGVIYGLPGIFGADMSASFNILDIPRGENVWERTARLFSGPTIGDIVAVGQAATDKKAPERRAWKRILMTLAEKNRALSVVDSTIRMILGDKAYVDPRGRKKYPEPLSKPSKIAKIGGFRTTEEARYSLWMDAAREAQAIRDRAIDDAVAAWLNNDTTKAEEVVERYNKAWPDMTIRFSEVAYRAKQRKKSAEESAVERMPINKAVRRAMEEEDNDSGGGGGNLTGKSGMGVKFGLGGKRGF